MADFGESSQWLKGKLSNESGDTYVNVYAVDTIRKINEDNYIIQCAGHRFKIRDCVWVASLDGIAPSEES